MDTNFSTFPLDAGNYLFSFAVATDIHWSSSNSIGDLGRMYKYSDRLLADVVSAINAESVNFTILLGDLTDNGLAYEFDNVTERLNKLDKPFYPVIGNHDKSEGAWITQWAELGQENTTYSFNFAGWHFIVNDIYPGLGDNYVSFIFGSLSDRSINVSFAPQNLEDGIRA